MQATNTPVALYEPLRLMFVLTPKCGSTTFIGFLADVTGIAGKDRNPRDAMARAAEDGSLARAGLTMARAMTDDELVRLREARPDWSLIANVRDPFARTLSAYRNKLNRYAQQFDPPAYRYGKLRQFLEGPRAWSDSNRARAHIATRIPFMAFLDGLKRHGVGFDNHYIPQSTLLALPRLSYDRLVRLENFRQEFPDAMRMAGLPEAAIARLDALPTRNASPGTGVRETLLTPEAKAEIAALYAADFDLLGYPR